MRRILLHLCGPLAINSYGLAIVAGLLLFVWLVQRSPQRKQLLSKEHFMNALMVGIFSAVIGGRLLFLFTTPNSWSHFYALWDGGFSILGSVIGVLITLPCYLIKKNIPVLPFLDLVALYAPLLQGISRVGCFFAGCCFGAHTTLPWAVTYNDTHSFAPLHIALHPTQLYSALSLFGIFLFMMFFVQRRICIPGQAVLAYLGLIGTERFMVDFFRADREFIQLLFLNFFSIHQWISLALIVVSCSIGISIFLTHIRAYNYHESV